MSFKTTKRSLASYKGHLNSAVKSFKTLINIKPSPTHESVTKSYSRLQTRMDNVFDSLDKLNSLFENDDLMKEENIDVETERTQAGTYYDELLNQQCEIEAMYAAFQSVTPKTTEPIQPSTSVIKQNPVVRLTALEPPSWSGVKADFYSWKRKFNHIMEEARISDELTQLCYLQNPRILLPEYQTLISDCSSINEVWSRLEERVPKETIKFEIISQFRKVAPLASRRTPLMLREFANEISLFCRRMADLGFNKDNYSCVVMQDVYERLDRDTALRYRSRIELKRELGQNVTEDLESLSAFIRSEATTLELTEGSVSQHQPKDVPKKFNAVGKKSEDNFTDNMLTGTGKCILGCEVSHRLIECTVYMNMSTDKRREFIRTSSKCFVCLGAGHSARGCSKKKENWKCKLCSGNNHHWTICSQSAKSPDIAESNLNLSASSFQSVNEKDKNSENNENKHDMKGVSATQRCPEGKSIHNKTEIENTNDFSPLVIVEVKDANGSWVPAKCFLDTGSNSSLVRSNFANRLKLHGNGLCNIKFGIAGGGVHYEKAEDFDMHIRPKGGNDSFLITATGIRRPCFSVQPIQREIILKHRHLVEVKDDIFFDGGEVDILIGTDYAPLILPEKVLRDSQHPDDFPSVAFTRLGCYIYGGLSKQSLTVNRILSINYVNKFEDDELKSYFYGDILGVKPSSLCTCTDKQILESSFIKHVRATTKINEEGRVCVKMPWKTGFPEKLPNNYHRAFNQLVRREKQLANNGKLEEYDKEIKGLVERGVVRVLSMDEASEADKDPSWYLNYHIVERLDKESTKLRLVFNSAAVFLGHCLNDALEKGPDYSNSLFCCLLRWRKFKIAVSGDIEKMFNQIAMTESDQRYHRFLWRDGDTEKPTEVYQWLRLLFGDKSSPDLAAYSLKFLADLNKERYPVGAGVLENETYVDDIGFSAEEGADAKAVINEVDTILKCGKFSVKVWNSNFTDVDQNPECKIVDVLGHTWDKEKDLISMKCRPMDMVREYTFTKRGLMGLVAKLWDPFGFLLPVTIKFRIDLQKIWQNGFDWDEKLPTDFIDEWKVNISLMETLKTVCINRCLKPEDAIGSPQAHIFSDGGDDAYGTCAFLRWPTQDGVKLSFVAAKAFVAPLKYKTTPRLELMGAVSMSRLVDEIITALGYDFQYKRFWIDSEVVLYWLLTQSSLYKPFISTRIQEFQDTHTNWKEEVRYVPSDCNPADCLTKPISVDKLLLWHEGEYCKFLKMDEEFWPRNFELNAVDVNAIKPLLEEKPTKKPKCVKGKRKWVIHNTPEAQCNDSDNFNCINSVSNIAFQKFDVDIANKFSSWPKLIKAVAFAKRCFTVVSFSGNLLSTPDELVKAEETLFFLSQRILREDTDNTKRRFVKYSPFIDGQGLIRAQGRLQNVTLSEKVKHPILLPGEHPLVLLFSTYLHKKLLHQGYRVILAYLFSIGILIGGGKMLMKFIARKCLFCRIRRRKCLEQKMGNLPSFRIQPEYPPFMSVAIDFFGFLKIRYGRNASTNGSVLIIACTTTRCIHLELCTNITFNLFIQAWRRFTTSRGVHPKHVFSDRGSTFTGGNLPLLQMLQTWDKYLLQREFPHTSFDFQWDFNVPTASHMNGVVESLIHSVRKALDASVTNYTHSILSYENWATVLSEITYVINSRPLFPEGDPYQFNCITGNSILHPYDQCIVPQFPPEGNSNPRNIFKVIQGKVDIFWSTWLKHVPPQLNYRNKWFHTRDNLEKGDFVIILEKGIKGQAAPRGLWKKGVVTDTHPGSDGLVRSVTVRDSNCSEYVRPIHKLCLIATRAELEDGN